MAKRVISNFSLLIAVALLTVAANLASAAAAQIVAFGASNTAGYGVGSDQAWPARLEAMLRASGLRTISAIPYVSGLPTQSDRIHLTAEAHAALAARLLPHAIAAIGSR